MKCAEESLRLYAVIDGSGDFEARAERAIRGGAGALQLRDKNLGEAALLEAARRLRALAGRYGIPFIVNDSLSAALESDADGLHVGQDDGDAEYIRSRLGPDKILGVSARTVAEALRAEKAGADYLGVGAMFPTTTKSDAAAVTAGTLTDICRSVAIPVVAIGGISAVNARELSRCGIAGIAVVSALFADGVDTEKAAMGLRAIADDICVG